MSRSFLVADHLLPMCQRCTGLYMGMGLSFIYVLLNPQYRKDFPSRSIVYVNIVCLLAMPVFGYHFLDPGPAWRLWSGLIYGNAIVLLLVPAVSIICIGGTRLSGHSDSSNASFWLFFSLLNTIPFWFPVQSIWFFYIVLLLVVTGLLCPAFCLLAVTFSLIKRTILKGFRNEYA
ncbi:MAG: hypothetical protein AMJ75_00180 [Phycisphaerae bacterium SM1_79]|nr:MAG: hypothetical protein AMJ75_00180 [Phycisphaerae bacterium SM1_79]